MHPHSLFPRPRPAFSLIEVLVSIAVLLTGIVVILSFFPAVLRQNQRSADVSVAAYLAQQKAEEIRRDDTSSGDLVAEIRSLQAPSAPIVFPLNPRFAYQFAGVSLLAPAEDPAVARVIVSYAPGNRGPRGVLYELRFGN